jgi:Activator of Hsp90 ATPase homolog 1-like protein
MPGERIVQSWRTADFSDEHEDSIITLTLEAVEGGTLLTLAHTNVPDGQTSYELGGWEEHYFEPMTQYFADRAPPEGAEETTQPATPIKRAAGRKKVKRAAPKPKAIASGRKSTQRVAPRAGQDRECESQEATAEVNAAPSSRAA